MRFAIVEVANPRRGGFVPIVAHGITPIDVATETRKFPHGVSPRSPDERLLARPALLWLASRNGKRHLALALNASVSLLQGRGCVLALEWDYGVEVDVEARRGPR